MTEFEFLGSTNTLITDKFHSSLYYKCKNVPNDNHIWDWCKMSYSISPLNPSLWSVQLIRQ